MQQLTVLQYITYINIQAAEIMIDSTGSVAFKCTLLLFNQN